MPNYTKNQLQGMINTYKQQVYYLQKDLENYDSLQREKCCECEHRAVQKYIDKSLLINDICELLNCEENEITDKIKKLLTNS